MKTIKLQYGTTEKKDAELVFRMMKTSDSLKFLLYLGKIVGGALGSSISAFSLGNPDAINKLGEGDFDVSRLGEAIPMILGRIDETETLEKINLILDSVTHAGTTLSADYFIFDGRVDLLIRVLKEATIENYRFFFQENTELFQKLGATRDAIHESLKRSTNQP